MANSKRKIKAWNSLWVTSDGGIYRDSKCTQPITPRFGKKGRKRFKYHKKWFNWARVIASNFIPNPNNYPNVCHKDNNPKNNHINNLYWGTQSMNIQQARDEGRLITLFKRRDENPSYGKIAYNHILSLSEENQLVLEVKSGEYTRVKLSLKWGVSRATINNILRRHGK